MMRLRLGRELSAVALLPFFASLSWASFIVANIAAKALTCEPLLLQWQGGKAPWTLSIVGSSGGLVETLVADTKVTAFHWTVNLEAGSVVSAQVTDSTGAKQSSNSIIVQSGSSGCTLESIDSPPLNIPPSSHSSSIAITTSSTSRSSSIATTAPVALTFISSSIATTASVSISTSSSIATTASAPVLTVAALPNFTAESKSSQKPSSTASTALQSPSSPSYSYPNISPKRTMSSAGIFGILFAIFVFLAALGFFFVRYRRRRLRSIRGERLPDLERRLTLDVDPTPISAVATIPDPSTTRVGLGLDIRKPNLGASTPSPGHTRLEVSPRALVSPGSSASKIVETPSTSASTSSYVGALHSRINALVEENRVLAELTERPETPPPAYNQRM